MTNHLPNPEIKSLSEIKKQRSVRIFISSTFLDMQAEREELVKYTFPELRQRMKSRGVDVIDVDLRWGITDEQKAEGKVLPICLGEIERCRPFFLGILGDRYGWVPSEIDPDLLRDQPWLGENAGMSVTAMEILHGVLKDPEMDAMAFFYFRDSDVSRRIESEISGHAGQAAQMESSRLKLTALKDEIRERGYPVREDYKTAKELGQAVLDDLWPILDRTFPEAESLTALERVRLDHEVFAEARRGVYVRRPLYIEELNRHASKEGPPLVLLGDAGSGKSAILANWVQERRTSHPQEFIVDHFIGCSSESTDSFQIIRRVIEEIKARYEEMEAVPDDTKKLAAVFPEWLARAAARGRLVLVLDALNQIDDVDNARGLWWLPEFFPANIKVILSSTGEDDLAVLKKRGYAFLAVTPLSAAEKTEFISRYLGKFRKGLSQDQLRQIAMAAQTSSPLFLKALLEELRVYGSHFGLEERIRNYLGSDGIEGLYVKILERCESDYEMDAPGLVGRSLSLLWAARRGLSEAELLELLSGEGGPMPRAHWAPLYLAIADSLASRRGCLKFSHDFFARAVENRYIPTPEMRRALHLKLADSFDTGAFDDRSTEELPWQLERAESWERLRTLLTNPEFFSRFPTKREQQELVGYWKSLGDRFDMAEEYKKAVPRIEAFAVDPSARAVFLSRAGSILYLAQLPEPSEILYTRALAQWKEAGYPDDPEYDAALTGYSDLLRFRDDWAKARPLLESLLSRAEKKWGFEHPQTAKALSSIAHSYLTPKDIDRAESILQKVVEIREKTLDAEHPDTAHAINDLGVTAFYKGDLGRAEKLYRRTLSILEKRLGHNHQETTSTLYNLASLLEKKGERKKALELYNEVLSIRERHFAPDYLGIADVLYSIAKIHYDQRDDQKALPLLNRALPIYEKHLGPRHPESVMCADALARVKEALVSREVSGLVRSRFKGAPKAASSGESGEGRGSIGKAGALLIFVLVLGQLTAGYLGAKFLVRRFLDLAAKILGDDLTAVLAQIVFITAVVLLGYLFYRFDRMVLRWFRRRAKSRSS